MQNQRPQRPTSHLDVRAFARSGTRLGGTAPLSEFARVAGDCVGASADAPVVWTAQGEARGGNAAAIQHWLHLQITAEVALVCQRCLDPVHTPLAVDQWFRFVPDEATAEQLDDDASEDLLVESDDFDLHQLVEDELVLALPLIASHTSCPSTPAMSVRDAGFELPDDAKAHPFAALGKLQPGKGKKGR